MSVLKLLFILLLMAGQPGRLLSGPVKVKGEIEVLLDFVKHSKDAKVIFATSFRASERETSDGRIMPGIFLHPGQRPGEIRYPQFKVPEIKRNERIYFITWIGFRDGVPWGNQASPRPEGVSFEIKAGNESLVRKHVEGPGWRFVELDLSRLAGRVVQFTLLTHPGKNTNWDWAVFGRPMLLLLKPSREMILSANAAGMGLVYDLKDSLPGIFSGTSKEGAGKRSILWSFSSDLKLESIGLTSGCPVPGEKSGVFVKIKNDGYGRNTFGRKMKLVVNNGAPRIFKVPVIEPGKEYCIRCGEIVIPRLKHIDLKAQLEEEEISTCVDVMPVCEIAFSLCGVTSDLTFFTRGAMVKYATLRAKGVAGSFAVIYPLATLALEKKAPVPVNFKLKKYDADSVEIVSETAGSSFTQTWKIAGDDIFEFKTALDTEGTIDIFHFGGPMILWGEGSSSFGAAHDFALLPGVEYLNSSDYSSSLRLADPPYNDHHVPLPLDLASGCAAISYRDFVLGLFWDQKQEWSAGNSFPLLYFDVPPGGGSKDYASMQLFVPSTAQGVKENGIISEKPFSVSSPVSITGKILAAGRASPALSRITKKPRLGDLVLESLKKYFDLYEKIEPAKPPRSWLEEKRLSRTGWLKTVYVKGKGMRHCVGDRWPPHPTPGAFTLLLLDALETGGEEGTVLLEKIQAWTDKAVKDNGPAYLVSRINCHIMSGDYIFYVGHLEEGLRTLRDTMLRIGRSLTPEGGTRWFPGRGANKKRLGRAGQVTSGNTARTGCALAYFARVTGDPEIGAFAKRALDHLEKYRVPRGAQGWECPLHCPDILTSAYAVRGCVDFYRFTGDQEYLDRARYWAWSGLPFVYSWGFPKIPSMKGNTTPILGATFFNHSWIGLPVVWCGLVYSYGLFQLAKVEDDPRWKRIAKAITVSSMYQQVEVPGKTEGCYPDSFSLKRNRRNPPFINPEDIMVNSWTDRGFDPRIKTEIIKFKGKKLFISSGARIEEIKRKKNSIEISLNFFPGRPVFLFAGRLNGEFKIYAGGKAGEKKAGEKKTSKGAGRKESWIKEIPEVTDLSKKVCGWKRLQKPEGVAVKAQADKDGKLEISIIF